MSDTKVTENKEPIIDELLQRIKDAGSNYNKLFNIEREERTKFYQIQTRVDEAKEKKVDKEELKILQAQMTLQEKCVNMVINAVHQLEDVKDGCKAKETTEKKIHDEDK